MEENPVVLAITAIAVVGLWVWVAWVVLEWRRVAQKAQLHKTLIERFSSSAELQAFLVSEGGDRLFRSLSLGHLAAKEKILASFSRGTIVALLGVSTLIVSLIQPEYAPIFLSAGIIIIALGAGLIISGLLSIGIGRKWGLFER